MNEIIGTVIAFLIIGGFVFYMLIFALNWASDALITHNEEKDRERLYKEKIKKEKEEADRLKMQNAHKVRTQYPPPEDKVTSFEITNTKDSIIVTEVVYAD